MGYSLIGFTVLCLGVNLSVMVQGTVCKIIYLVKSCKSKIKKERHKVQMAKARQIIIEAQNLQNLS